MQFIASLLIIPLGIVAGFLIWGNNPEWKIIVVSVALVAFFRVITYSHKAAMRSLGEARFEAIAKVLERSVITIGYFVLYLSSVKLVSYYAIAMLIGVIVTAIYVWKIGETIINREKSKDDKPYSENNPRMSENYQYLRSGTL